MATFNHISGAEPSTVTFKAATVSMTRNSSVMHQEIISLGDPDSSLAVAAVLNTGPASTAWGLVTRPVGYSTIVSVANTVTIAGNSTVLIGGPVSTAAPATSDTGVIVRQVGYSTIVSVANTVTIQGNSTVLIGGPVSTAAPATSDTGVVVRQVGYVAPSTTVSIANTPTVTIAGPVSTAAPASGDTGVVVRQVGYVAPSTTVSIANTVTIQGNSTVVLSASTVTIDFGGMQSSAAASSGSSGLLIRPILDVISNTASTSAFATSTQFTISGSTAQRKYVTAYSITSTDLTASVVRFMGGSTLAWPVRLQAVSSAIAGANLAVSAPAYLFRTDAASSLTLNVSGSSRGGWCVGVSFFLAP